jgi:hypothetical protein
MTNVMILHGTGCPPDLYWYTYVKENLENKGYTVSVSNLPNAGEANIEEWLPFYKNSIPKLNKQFLLQDF